MHFDQVTLFFGSLAIMPAIFGVIQLARCGGRHSNQAQDH
jgi:hypothetical protein